ncbi:MAG: hypothetical protein A2Y70_08585 [Candidatus Aminicenantes bacterium RBG_13_64_14]|nr:MAG: hypothetical protein A2Y70_08585 [Candidatus Aminicenantes bacterium RBG_13_64_14]
MTFPDRGLYFLSMTRKTRLLLILAFFSFLATDLPSAGQVPEPAAPSSLKTFFTVRSAQPDDTLPPEIRKEFEKDDGSPLRSVAVDLDGNGKEEKFVLCGVPSAAGGPQWLVYDPATGPTRGIVVGTIVFIARESDDGYPKLETYWMQGGAMSVVFRYKYARGRYGRIGTRAMTLWETSEYFRAKPPLDLDKELVEIK